MPQPGAFTLGRFIHDGFWIGSPVGLVAKPRMFSASYQRYSVAGDAGTVGDAETLGRGDAGTVGRGDAESGRLGEAGICCALTWPEQSVAKTKTIRIALEMKAWSTREKWWLLRLQFFSETCSSL